MTAHVPWKMPNYSTSLSISHSTTLLMLFPVATSCTSPARKQRGPPDSLLSLSDRLKTFPFFFFNLFYFFLLGRGEMDHAFGEEFEMLQFQVSTKILIDRTVRTRKALLTGVSTSHASYIFSNQFSAYHVTSLQNKVPVLHCLWHSLYSNVPWALSKHRSSSRYSLIAYLSHCQT